MLYAGMLPTHGLKTINARRAEQAYTGFRANAGGTAPLWVVPIKLRDCEAIRRLQRLGWRGRRDDLTAELASWYADKA